MTNSTWRVTTPSCLKCHYDTLHETPLKETTEQTALPIGLFIMSNDETLWLSTFIILVRRNHQSDESGASVQDSATSVLASNESWKRLGLDTALSENDFDIFDVLVSCPRFHTLVIYPTIEASTAASLLDRALPLMSNHLEGIALAGIQMTLEEAKDIFRKLQTVKSIDTILFFVIDYTDEVMEAFSQYIRDTPSLKMLSLCSLDGHEISARAFQSICSAISVSESPLEMLTMNSSLVGDTHVQAITESLTKTIVDYPTILRLHINPSNTWNTNTLCHSLSKTDAVMNFDLSFRELHEHTLLFDRNPWWKRLLANDNIPLNLWPSILKKADTWKQDTSHSHLDILNYLIKEKSSVLLQNVKRRRIRKRKRFQIEA